MRAFFGNRKNRRILRYVGTALALGLLVYLLRQQGWDEILSSIRRISLQTFILVAVLAFLSRVAVAARWAALVRLSGIPLDLGKILRITYAGLFASNFLPTSIGGDIVRLAGVAFVEKDKGKYASSIAVDRLVGLTGMAFLLPLGAYYVIAGPGPGMLEEGIESLSVLPLALGAVAASWPKRAWDWSVRGVRRSVDLIVQWLSRPVALAAALGFTFIHMILKFTSMRILFSTLGEDLDFWVIAGLWSFVYFVSLFPVSINSLGLMEVSAGLVYSTVGGVSVAGALTVALLMRTVEAMASLPGVFALPGMLALVGESRNGVDPDKAD
jgi:uncharacterized membrane protein YbhN (UPF0104 family)